MEGGILRNAGYLSNASHSPDKWLRHMYPIRNIKSCASTDFSFMIEYAFLRWLSYIGRRADALALRADERRDKLRKATGRCKWSLIRRYLNGATRQRRPLSLITESIGYEREPGELKHLSSRRKRKQKWFRKSRRANAEEPKPGSLLPGVRTA